MFSERDLLVHMTGQRRADGGVGSMEEALYLCAMVPW